MEHDGDYVHRGLATSFRVIRIAHPLQRQQRPRPA